MYISSFLRKMGIDLDGDKPDFYNGFKVGGTEVTATAAELNALGSQGLSAAEVAVLNAVTPGTSAASKAVVLGADSKIDTIDVTSLKVGGTAVTSTAAELNKIDGYTGTYSDLNKVAGMAAINVSPIRVAKVALAALDTAGGVLAWANPEGQSILLLGVAIVTTTKSTGASTVDVGIAANGTTSDDTIMDGIDTGTAAGAFNSIDDKGTNGLGSHSTVLTSSQYITASKASGACAGLVGYAYIQYCLI